MKKDLCDPANRKTFQTKVRSAMDYAIREKLQKYNNALLNILRVLQKIDFVFNWKDFSFSDDKGNEHGMNYLSKHSFISKYPRITEKDESSLAIDVNDLIQLKSSIDQYHEKTGGYKNVMERMAIACQRRKEFVKTHGNLMEELNGKYQSKIDVNATYFISTDPYQIFTKSTGRTWSPKNCERIDGESSHGIDSDIAHDSAVLYILDNRKKGFDKAIARMNLRRCVVNERATNPKEKYSIGWDVNWYRGNDSHARYHALSKKKFDNMCLSGNDATNEIIQIIHDHGFNTDYKACITPFHHEGYSDWEGATNAVINYQSKWEYRCRKCGTPTRDIFFDEYDGMCPFCYHHPDQRPEYPDI